MCNASGTGYGECICAADHRDAGTSADAAAPLPDGAAIADAGGNDGTLADASAPDSVGDAPAQDGGELDAVTQDSAQADASDQDVAQADVLLHDAAQQDTVQQDAAQQDAVQQDAAQQDVIQQDVIQQDVIQHDVIQHDAVQHDAVQQDAAVGSCQRAALEQSSLGCEFFPTVTMNSQVDLSAGFTFAVAVAAPATNTGPADVTITGGSLSAPVTQQVAPGQARTITLPWVTALKQSFSPGTQSEKSVLLPNGAYHLVSTAPLAVFQFNPLEYKVGSAYSYSSDASQLLPRHSWADANGASSYIVVSRPTMEVRVGSTPAWAPGFFAVVPAEDDTHVSITFTAHTLAGAGNSPAAYAPGATDTFVLARGTVLLIASDHDDTCTGPTDSYGYAHCNLANGYDLTGTEITADKPIGVFGGHDCDFVPFTAWACDHLEEQLYPVRAWGKHYVGTHTVSTTDPDLWRVVSGSAGNVIHFDPPINDQLTSSTITQVTLDRGKWLEFVTAQDFAADGSAPFAVAGFMVGQNYSNSNPGSGAPGDPSLTLAVPVEQFLRGYSFLAPDTYQQSYVSLVARLGATVVLDGTAVSGFTAVGTGGWGVKSLAISGGFHTATTTDSNGFGIQVYGVGSYTSYMYPGGLGLNPSP